MSYSWLKIHSVERVNQYLKVEQERLATSEGLPPAHWPSSGELDVRGLSASYSKGGPQVLRDISFHVSSGERVGVGKVNLLTRFLLALIKLCSGSYGRWQKLTEPGPSAVYRDRRRRLLRWRVYRESEPRSAPQQHHNNPSGGMRWFFYALAPLMHRPNSPT